MFFYKVHFLVVIVVNVVVAVIWFYLAIKTDFRKSPQAPRIDTQHPLPSDPPTPNQLS